MDHAKVEALARGEVLIHEPGLAQMVSRHLADGHLAFTSDMAPACAGTRLVLIAVATPASGPGFADLGYVISAVRAVGEHLDGSAVIVVKSTVPPGTCERVGDTVRATLAARGANFRVDVASNPEFLREGSAVRDFLVPDRIVIGAWEPRVMALLEQLYEPLIALGHRLLKMDPISAEMSKYASNAMLAIRISAVNELAAIAEACDADFAQVREVLASDRRIGAGFLAPGAGYGGSCLPKDMRALARLAQDAGIDTPLVAAAEAVNRRARERLFEKIERWAAPRGGLRGCTIGLWGLAFKPGTDDVREAPSLTLLRRLLEAGARLRAHDPVAISAARRVVGYAPGLTWAASPLDALRGADTLVLVTEWEDYRAISPTQVAGRLADRVVFDGRNALDAKAYRACGLTVVGVGRSQSREPADEPVAGDSTTVQPQVIG
jgi:UDPglucose 6-dehydrogenase